MIKIIKPGKTDFRLTCNKCGCVFEYNTEDIVDCYIKCPTCGKQYYGFEEEYILPNTTPTITGVGTFRVPTDPCENCDFTKTLKTTGYYVGDAPCQWCSKSPYKVTCFTTSTSGCTCSARDYSSHDCECESASYEPTSYANGGTSGTCEPTYTYSQYAEPYSCCSEGKEFYTCTAEGVNYEFTSDSIGAYESNSFNLDLSKEDKDR